MWSRRSQNEVGYRPTWGPYLGLTIAVPMVFWPPACGLLTWHVWSFYLPQDDFFCATWDLLTCHKRSSPATCRSFHLPHIVASELKDSIWHSLEWQIGSFSSEATIWSCHLIAVPKVALNTRLFRPSCICSSGGLALYSRLCLRCSATCSLVTCLMWSSCLSNDVFFCATCPDMGVFLPVVSDKRSPPATYPTYMYVWST